MEKIRFMTSLLTFYLKGEINRDKNFIKLRIPNTILGLIPLGASKKTIAVNQIASVDTDFRLKFKQLLLGIIVAIIGIDVISNSNLYGLLVLIFGILTILNSFQTALVISTTASEAAIIFFVVFEKAKAEKTADMINNLIDGRINDTNTKEQTDRIVDAINKK